MTETERRCKPASKKHVVPCPKCGAGWPIVQALWSYLGESKKPVLICCCTRCGIEGTIRPRCTATNPTGDRCEYAEGHKGNHRLLRATGDCEFLSQ